MGVTIAFLLDIRSPTDAGGQHAVEHTVEALVSCCPAARLRRERDRVRIAALMDASHLDAVVPRDAVLAALDTCGGGWEGREVDGLDEDGEVHLGAQIASRGTPGPVSAHARELARVCADVAAAALELEERLACSACQRLVGWDGVVCTASGNFCDECFHARKAGKA